MGEMQSWGSSKVKSLSDLVGGLCPSRWRGQPSNALRHSGQYDRLLLIAKLLVAFFQFCFACGLAVRAVRFRAMQQRIDL